MANKTEFSRLVTKGSSVSGVTPTINSGDTIDSTWIDSDILNREMFINVEDKKVFIRANDEILEFNTFGTGSTAFDFCSTGVKSDSYSACTDTGFLSLAYSGFGGDIMLTSSGESENRFIRMSSNIPGKSGSRIFISNPNGFVQSESQRFDVLANSAMNLNSDSINVYRNSDDTGFDIYSDAITFYDANGDSPLFLSSSGVLPALGTGTSISNLGIDVDGYIVDAGAVGDFCSTGIKTDLISGCTPGAFQIDMAYGSNPARFLLSNDGGNFSDAYLFFNGSSIALGSLTGNTSLGGGQSSSIGSTSLDTLSGFTLALNSDPLVNEILFSNQVLNERLLSINDSIIKTDLPIAAETGGGQIDLAYFGSSNEVAITNDSGALGSEALYLSPSQVQIFTNSTPGIIRIYNNSCELSMRSDTGRSHLVSPKITLNSNNSATLGSIPSGEIQAQFNAKVDVFTNGSYNNGGTFIGAKAASIKSGITNSVVIGGSGITGTTSNTVYVPDLVIKKSAAVPTSSGDTVGNIGSVTWDDNYLYTKTNTGWGRVALDYGF